MTKTMLWMRRMVALASLFAAAALCWQCIDIYRLGNAPANLDANGVHLNAVYSREIVAGRLKTLALPLAGYALLTLCALVMQSLCTAEKHTADPEQLLRLMKARLDVLPEAAQKEERLRRTTALVTALAVLLCALPALGYLLNRSHFTSWDLERVMGQMLLHVMPWVALIFVLLCMASHLRARSAQREIALLKGLPKVQAAPENPPRTLPLVPLRIALYAVALLFIVLGVMNGGLRDVLVKAINICTECIGLG